MNCGYAWQFLKLCLRKKSVSVFKRKLCSRKKSVCKETKFKKVNRFKKKKNHDLVSSQGETQGTTWTKYIYRN